MEESKESKENKVTGKQPFNFGIKRFKRDLAAAGAPKAYINRASKIYKEKVYVRVEEVKAKMEAEFAEKQLQESKDATDTKGAVITTPERSS